MTLAGGGGGSHYYMGPSSLGINPTVASFRASQQCLMLLSRLFVLIAVVDAGSVWLTFGFGVEYPRSSQLHNIIYLGRRFACSIRSCLVNQFLMFEYFFCEFVNLIQVFCCSLPRFA